MRKWMLIIVLFLMSVTILQAEKGREIVYRDSVIARVECMSHDTIRLSYLAKVAYQHQYYPYNKMFATELYRESKRQNNIYYENLGVYYLAGYYDKKHDPDSLFVWVERLKALAPQIGNYDYYLERKAAVSRALASKRMVEKAIYVAKEVLEEADKQNSNNGRVAAYNSLGCAYGVSSREELSLEMLLKAYNEFTPATKDYLKADILSRIAQIYGNGGKDYLKLPYLNQMRQVLQEVMRREPEMRNNWSDMAIDCEVKYILHYLNQENFEEARLHLEQAKLLLAPHVDPVFWLNVQLAQLQYYSRTKEYDKAIALIDEVTPIVLNSYVNTFGVLINYKSTTQMKKGDVDGAIATRYYLIHTQDSLNNAFSNEQLEEMKEIYHIDELLMEKQKINHTNHIRIFIILLVLIVLAFLFYIYTRYLSGKIAQIEKEAADAAAQTESDNRAKERLKMEISHDVRTPLNAVVGFAELLAESDDLDKESKLGYGRIIQENAERLLEYVNNILELSRLESGKIKYEEENVEVIGLCRDVIRLVNEMKNENGRVLLHTDIDSQQVVTDRKWMISLLRNLLVSGDECVENRIIIEISRDETLSLLIFSVVNTLMAQDNYEDKKRLIRNEINSHFIRFFGGTYTVTEIKGKPVIIFTCPLHRIID